MDTITAQRYMSENRSGVVELGTSLLDAQALSDGPVKGLRMTVMGNL